MSHISNGIGVDWPLNSVVPLSIAFTLAIQGMRSHAGVMFVVTEADAAAIRAIFDQRGELSAAIELRRLFPGIIDNVQARECARTIAGWKPLPVSPRPVRRSHQNMAEKPDRPRHGTGKTAYRK